MEFLPTTALKKLLSLNKKIRDVRGSTGAGKTIGITAWDIDYAQSVPNQVIDIVSTSYPHLEQGVMRDFKNIMQAQRYWRDNEWNETHHYYTFPNKSQIHFQSYDKLGKAHGPRRDVLHLNEANYLPWAVVDQLLTRTRKIAWCEYNPSTEFWMQEHLIGRRDDVESLKLTYKDNEGLSEAEIKEIESHKHNASWWKVYGEGEFGDIEGLIYKDWKVIEGVPQEAKLVRRWLDYGYSNDPTAIGDIYKWNDSYVLDEVLYQKGLLNKQIADVILNLPSVPVAADSAEPKSNDELKLYGLTIIPAKKGKDSVNSGIQLVQQQKIFVTQRSVNIIKERQNYMWMTDPKTGKTINEPIPTWNHHMDGIRYAFGTLDGGEDASRQLQEHLMLNRDRIHLNEMK